MTAIAAKMTSRGVLVPRSMMAVWGNISEVEIELQGNLVVIKPSQTHDGEQVRQELIDRMKAVGLVEDLPWHQPASVTADERARLAKRLSSGTPLSETIIEDREEYA